MKIISCELAKKLKQSGIKHKGHFEWIIVKSFGRPILCGLEKKYEVESDGLQIKKIYPAYTLDEILEMLPSSIENKDGIYYRLSIISKWQPADGFIFRYCKPEFYHDNPAEAAGQLLIWCIENDYVKPESIK